MTELASGSLAAVCPVGARNLLNLAKTARKTRAGVREKFRLWKEVARSGGALMVRNGLARWPSSTECHNSFLELSKLPRSSGVFLSGGSIWREDPGFTDW